MKEKEEIWTEIEKLQQIRPFVQQYEDSGRDNHALIDAQFEALQKRMDRGMINEWWPGEDQQGLRDVAQAAIDWMNGHPENAPHVLWEELADG